MFLKSSDPASIYKVRSGTEVGKLRDLIHRKAALVFQGIETEPKLHPLEEQRFNPGANLINEARDDIRIRELIFDS